MGTQTPQSPPEAVVARLWNMAAAGDLLDAETRGRAAALFRKPPTFANKQLLVISNEWGPPKTVSTTDSNARVVVLYWPLGHIDSLLKYTPFEHRPNTKFGIEYTMLLTQTKAFIKGYSRTPTGGYERDKALDRAIPAGPAWQIGAPESPPLPFATVNAAIRYVLEKRNESKDPVIRTNADRTLTELLALH